MTSCGILKKKRLERMDSDHGNLKSKTPKVKAVGEKVAKE
jgi:hypothetical protein